MENEGLIKKFVKVYTEIERKCLHPQFSFPKGGKVSREMETFIKRFKDRFGDVSDSRVVDYCVCIAHFWRGLERQWNPNFSFGPKAIQRYVDFKNGKKYYEDSWLKEHGLSRSYLESLIMDTSNHPLAKYIYMEAEEVTKSRAQKIGAYIALCDKSTLLWSPFSPSCQKCEQRHKCKQYTNIVYPELYRIRLEKWQKKK